MKNAYIEGYGCSLAKSETEQIISFLKENGYSVCDKPEEASLLLINTCGVKERTEKRMVSRIKELCRKAKNDARVIAFGCLTKISPKKIKAVSGKVVLLGPKLEELSKFLAVKEKSFSPMHAGKESKYIGIIPIALGCLGNCSYCSVRLARGTLESYDKKEIVESIKELLPEKKEFWLTAEDAGCYGFDRGTNIAELLEEVLRIKGNFRIRIGMMNPGHAKKIIDKLLPLFRDKRLYRFLHLPVQSGSNKILEKMRRPYTAEDFEELVSKIKENYGDFTIVTDVIVGFPGETKTDFEETIKLLKKTKPYITNVSRFGSRPNTDAAKMKQTDTRVRKERSRISSELAREFSYRENLGLVGRKEEIYVSKKGKTRGYLGWTLTHKQVIIRRNKLGEFVKVRITRAKEAYLRGSLL